MSIITDNVLKIIRIRTPGSVEAAVRLALGETVGVLCREILQRTAPTDYQTDIATWMTDQEWQDHHTLVIDGTLARLYVEPKKPYSDVQLAQAHMTLWTNGIEHARSIAAASATATDAYVRLMANLRTAAPAMRDSAIWQELFNTVDYLTRSQLQIAPPDGTKPAPQWLTADQWANNYRLLYAGTMVRILTQPGKAWTDAATAAIYQQQWTEELAHALADENASAATGAYDLIMQNLRVKLSGAKDTALRLELFSTVREACSKGYIWEDAVPFTFSGTSLKYNIVPNGAELVSLLAFVHPTYDVASLTFDGTSLIFNQLSDKDRLTPFVCKVILSPAASSNIETPLDWIPDDLWGQHMDMLIDGTLARMHMQRAKPYTDAALAVFHGRKFHAAMSKAYQGRTKAKVFNASPWHFPRFGR